MKRPSNRDAESLKHTCGNCNAQPGEPCTTPTGTGRRVVTWFHYGRLPVAEPWLGRPAAEPFEARYPEHAKQVAVADRIEHATELLEWLSEHDLYIARVKANDVYVPVNMTSQELVAEIFGIDQSKIDQEKRQMIEGLSGG